MAFFKRLFRFTSRSSGDIRADVGDEIAFHLEMRTRELVERGWTPEAARREARQQFGSVDTTADYCRRLDEDREQGTRARRRFDELRQDAIYGGRMLRRHPALSAVAILTIGLGIGASTLVYSVFHAALLAPLPYASAERLMVVRLSLPDYKDLRESTSLFEDSGVFASNLFTIGDDQVLAGVVSPGFFRTLGVAPALGRVFDENDGGAALMVLGHGMWKRRFGGDPQIVGRTVRLSNTVYTITGVMPPSFQFPTRAFEFWSNVETTLAIVPQQAQNRSLRIFQAVGRLRESLPLSQAQAELTALADRLAATYPDTNASVAMTLVAVRERLVGNVRGALRLALGAVACLLFIACVNVANLTLTRMTARTQELAVRAALGAGRGRIARQLLTESLLIASLGGALGLALARWGLLALPALVGDRIPRTDDVALDLPVLAVAAGAILVAGLLVAAVPVLQLSINGIEPALKGGGRSDGDMRAGTRLRSALVVTQIAVAVIVLSGALLLTRSLVRLLNADAGFVVSNLLTFNLQLVDAAEPAARVALATRTLAAIAALPGIEAVGGATGLAPRTAQRSTTFEVEGAGEVEVDSRRGYFIASTPDYFRALGTRVLAGREFAASDTAAAPLVVVVSETLAQRFFPGGGVIGRRLRLINPEYPDTWRTIVGVVADVRYQGLDDVDPPVVYTPFAQTPFRWLYVQVRTLGDPAAAIQPVRRAVKTVSPALAMANPLPMEALVAESAATPRFMATLIALFASLAMLLATIGLHGVVAFGVARRTREIAIRLALGASRGSVRWRVIRDAMRLAVVGVALGLAGAVAMGGVLQGMLYDTAPTDPVALGLVAAGLLCVAAAASAIPAARATRVQPVEALRLS